MGGGGGGAPVLRRLSETVLEARRLFSQSLICPRTAASVINTTAMLMWIQILLRFMSYCSYR
jgi:hypothetical protein